MLDPLLEKEEPNEHGHQNSPLISRMQLRTRKFYNLLITDSAQVLVCLALHSLLILAHIALIVVLSQHAEHGVVVESIEASNDMSLAVTVITQTIGTVSTPPQLHRFS